MDTVTTIITNYKTLRLVKKCFESVRSFYPELPIVVLDNGSDDESTEYIANLKDDHTAVVLNISNVGHGPAMDQMIREVDSDWIWTIDSDTEILLPDIIINMLGKSSANTYAIGWLRYVDRESGVPADWFLGAKDSKQFIPYIHPCCALYKRSTYMTMRPFIHHGAPCLLNMLDANDMNLGLVEFPVFSYVMHWIGGTRRMFDSSAGDWDATHNEKPKSWDPNKSVPI